MTIWNNLPRGHYVALAPWCWVQLESAEPPGPFPFIGGVAPEVVASLQEAHSLLSSAIDTAISDVFSKRAPLDDAERQRRLEDAYAELVHARPYLKQHIRCGRRPDGTFQWDFPTDPSKSAKVTNGGLRIFHAINHQAIPIGFNGRPLGPQVGKLLGLLDGTHTADELRATLLTMPRDAQALLTNVMEALQHYGCLVVSATTTVRKHWFDLVQDQDIVHLGHAALLYRQRESVFLFDPWLLPWFAESPMPSLWGGLLPKPAAVFLTHDHDDHVDPRTLLHLPKDTPIIVPSAKNRKQLFFDYRSLLAELGFEQIIELAHGKTWPFEGGTVVSVPF